MYLADIVATAKRDVSLSRFFGVVEVVHISKKHKIASNIAIKQPTVDKIQSMERGTGATGCAYQ